MISEAFNNELNYIQDQEFKNICIEMLNGMPQYITTQPSSTTGKYHPTDEINADGMIRHIKRCVLIARELCVMHEIPVRDQDVLIAGCIFHDSLKMGPKDVPSGVKVYTDASHPIYVYEYITKYLSEHTLDIKLQKLFYKLAMVCLYHEGKWTIDKAKERATPKSDYVKFLCDVMHTVDFIASRRSVYEIMQPSYFEGTK